MRFLLDEMFPPQSAAHLHDEHALLAEHVPDVGLAGAEDRLVAQHAREHGCALVTENVADFVGETDLVLVFVLKRNLPPGKAQASALADVLARWNHDKPEPYLGQHWPH